MIKLLYDELIKMNLENMLNQTITINYKNFLFKCVNLPNGKNDYEFTYKTEGNRIATIIAAFFELMKEFGNSKNFKQDFEKSQRNFHAVEAQHQINLIEKIYEKCGYNEKQVNELTQNSVIFQIVLKDKKTRLFFLKEVSANNSDLVIKPLFIDANHLIYSDEGKDNQHDNKYGPCLVCHKTACDN